MKKIKKIVLATVLLAVMLIASMPVSYHIPTLSRLQ
jgi:hypothetical protein